MLATNHKDVLYDFLTQPRFSVWRHMLFILMLIPIGLSQSFFALGSNTEIPNSTIYCFGVCFSAITIAIVYFNSYYLVPRFLSKGEYANYFMALLFAVLGFVALKYVAEYYIFSYAGIRRGFNGVTILDGLSNLMIYTVCIASGSITILLKQWTADHVKIAHLENKQLKNSIDELKSRIHPKFLYATLDYAARNVKSEPEQTSNTLIKLSELLKYQLYDATRNHVLLASDIEFIRHYLLLEQQNSENRFSFTLSVVGDTRKLIPSALFTPWVEEIARQHPAELGVKFEVDDCLIKFACTVSGISLVDCDFQKPRQKLKMLYGDNQVVSKGINSIELQINIC